MSVEIYVWLPRAYMGGHASLVLSSGTYISWRTHGTNIGNVDLKADTAIQKREPDLTFTALGLDELSIQHWWTDFKIRGWPHWLMFQNSFSMVVSALRAGGADKRLTIWQKLYYGASIYWTASWLVYYATDLEFSSLKE